jgi:hypothetical protein
MLNSGNILEREKVFMEKLFIGVLLVSLFVFILLPILFLLFINNEHKKKTRN